jgi:hypothetical protein
MIPLFFFCLIIVGAQRNKWEIECCLCELSKIPSRFFDDDNNDDGEEGTSSGRCLVLFQVTDGQKRKMK